MVNKKLKKALMVLGLGLGMGIGFNTAVVAYPNDKVCMHLQERCLGGDAVACGAFADWCHG